MEAAKGKDDPVCPKSVAITLLFHHQLPHPPPKLPPEPLLYRLIRVIVLTDESRVFLHATDESALANGITMDALSKFAAEPEARGGGGSLEGEFPISPSNKAGSMVRETH